MSNDITVIYGSNNKRGITLSGGGFMGIAHLGILQYLNELGIPIHAVSGALIGAFVAEGFAPLDMIMHINLKRNF